MEGDMELGVTERFLLLGILGGVTANITELRILRELREELSFSEEEHARLKIVEEGGRLLWEDDPEKPLVKEVEVGGVARGLIVRRLKEMNRNGQLADDHLDIIDLFPEIEE
jgi:hypothetical protein